MSFRTPLSRFAWSRASFTFAYTPITSCPTLHPQGTAAHLCPSALFLVILQHVSMPLNGPYHRLRGWYVWIVQQFRQLSVRLLQLYAVLPQLSHNTIIHSQVSPSLTIHRFPLPNPANVRLKCWTRHRLFLDQYLRPVESKTSV